MPNMHPVDLLVELCESKKTDFGKVDFECQSFAQKVFTAIWAAHTEVANGGFWQYFANSSAETAHFLPIALMQIGAQEFCEIYKEAVQIAYPNGLPNTASAIMKGARKEFGSQIHYSLNDVTAKLYLCPDSLTELLYSFVIEHPEEFALRANNV